MTGQSRTRADLVNRALQVLQIAEVGQDPSAEDTELVDSQVDAVCASLAAREIIFLRIDQGIPLAVFEEVAACLAASVPDYGRSLDATEAENRLRYMQRGGPAYIPLRADFF